MNLHQMTFGRLTVTEDREVTSHEFVWCRCSCGAEVQKHVNSMRRGKTTSCGCLRRGDKPKLTVTRSDREHRMFSAWMGMISRCYSPQHESYSRYGGRGIKVDPKWFNFQSFLQDVGDRPEGMMLDRIDNDGDYCKVNCRWATPLEQLENRSTTLWFLYKGEWLTLTDLAVKSNAGRDLIYRRLRRLQQGFKCRLPKSENPELWDAILSVRQGLKPK